MLVRLVFLLVVAQALSLLGQSGLEPSRFKPPAASSRLDLTDYAELHNIKTFIGSCGFDSEQCTPLPAEVAVRLKKVVSDARYKPIWFLVGKDSVMGNREFEKSSEVHGFGVTLGVSAIDSENRPIDTPKPLGLRALFRRASATAALRQIVNGTPNAKYRIITIWVYDLSKTHVQSDNHVDPDDWESFRRNREKSAPISALKFVEMEDVHVQALVYEYVQSPLTRKYTLVTDERGTPAPVENHLKASGLWTRLGLN